MFNYAIYMISLLLLSIPLYNRCIRLNRKTAIVLVLGDLGHSPRTISHAQSLLRNGYRVHLIGYMISKLPYDILENKNCTIHKLGIPTLLGKRNIIVFVLFGIYRLVSQFLELLFILFKLNRPGILLVQNPPAVPTLLVAQFYGLFTGCKLFIDWHNFGYSIIKLQKGSIISTPFRL